MLGEEVGVANVEGRHCGVECRHGDGGDLRADCGQNPNTIIKRNVGINKI